MHRVMLDKAAGRHRKSRQKQKKEAKEKKRGAALLLVSVLTSPIVLGCISDGNRLCVVSGVGYICENAAGAVSSEQ